MVTNVLVKESAPPQEKETAFHVGTRLVQGLGRTAQASCPIRVSAAGPWGTVGGPGGPWGALGGRGGWCPGLAAWPDSGLSRPAAPGLSDKPAARGNREPPAFRWALRVFLLYFTHIS